MIWWEDFKVGDQAEMGRHTFGEDEILKFGREFDPQAFHADPQAAKGGFDRERLAPARWRCVMVESYLKQARASATRPGVGLVKHRWEATNQHGELVMTMEGWGMFGRRPAV